MGQGNGVGRAKKKNYLWKDKAGFERQEFQVQLAKVRESLCDVLDFLGLGLPLLR